MPPESWKIRWFVGVLPERRGVAPRQRLTAVGFFPLARKIRLSSRAALRAGANPHGREPPLITCGPLQEHLHDHGRQLLRPVQHGEPRPAENPPGITGCLTIDRQAEHSHALSVRLRDRLSRILETVASFVEIDVVRLAVGEEEQQAGRGSLSRHRAAVT